jgi:hypothetical protein
MAALILGALAAASIAAAAASSTAAAAPPLEAEPTAQFLPVAGCQVVLTTRVHDDWARGAPRARPGEYGSMPSAIVRDVDEGRIPRRLAAWHGARVKLFDLEGPLGKATIRDLAVLDRFDEAVGGAGNDRREAGWVVSDGALVGRLEADQTGACARALWARPADAPVPQITPARPASGALRTAALRSKTFECGRSARDGRRRHPATRRAPL